jgi:AbrB family looped-hinge helix DNA binding protein
MAHDHHCPRSRHRLPGHPSNVEECRRQQVSLLLPIGKEAGVDAAAKVTSKGQVTVPKAVRDALGIKEGDEIVFRVEGNRAVLARTPDFLVLAGTIRVPAAKRNVAWDEVIRRTRSDRAATRR